MSRHDSIVGIQYLRGLAAVAVVFDHCVSMVNLPRYFGEMQYRFFVGGYVGVPIFFVISGIIISIVSLDKKLQPKLTSAEFSKRRFTRIIPFMWICVIGYALLSFAGTGVFEFTPTLRALTLWPIGEVKPNVIWTLRHEFLFYIVFSLTMLVGSNRLFLIIAWFVSPFFLSGYNYFFGISNGGDLVEFVNFLFSPFNMLFGMGFLIGVMWIKKREFFPSNNFSNMISITILVLFAMWICNLLDRGQSIGQSIILTLFCSLVGYLGLLARESDTWLGRLGKILGDASYSIYLVHNPALLCCLELSKRLGNPVASAYSIPVFITCAVAAGVLTHYFVEKPLLKWLAGPKKGSDRYGQQTEVSN